MFASIYKKFFILLRAQRLRQRTAPAPTTSVSEVNPEFLAALPPNIQEEVLAQQRAEQQRAMATNSNPEDPVDTEEFFRNLQPSLRQAVSILFFVLGISFSAALVMKIIYEKSNKSGMFDLIIDIPRYG